MGPDGGVWRFEPDQPDDVTDISKALSNSVSRELWRQAAKHSEGSCLANGGDLTVLRQNVKRLRNKDMYQEAGALEGLTCGTIWNADRQKRAGYKTPGVCERCDVGAPTLRATGYTSALARPPSIILGWRALNICVKKQFAIWTRESMDLWIRGIVPLPWNPVDPPQSD